MPDFSADAFIVGGRWQHDLTNDHFGSLPDTMVTISSPVGPWPEGTPVHVVIQDLYARIVAVMSANRRVSVFTADCYIDPRFFRIDSVIKKTISSSFTANAFFQLSGTQTFTANAVIRAKAEFTVDAILV